MSQIKIEERAPTPFTEDGKSVLIQLIIYKPSGEGPFPTLMFNHGSTGIGDNPDLFKQTDVIPQLAKHFNALGYLVAFPQRRGRGTSDGLYDEGFESDRSRYSDIPELSLAGLDRALLDLDAASAYLQTHPDVDPGRMLIGGHSRGGILSIVYAGTKPNPFKGAINFVGGWISDKCPDPEAINTVAFIRGAKFERSTLWLYGNNDPFYSESHSKRNFEAFCSAGGRGTFKCFDVDCWENGHGLAYFPHIWGQEVSSYLSYVYRDRSV